MICARCGMREARSKTAGRGPAPRLCEDCGWAGHHRQPRNGPRGISISQRDPFEVLNPREASDDPRPRTRGECLAAERPCPWIGCRHHLAYGVSRCGSLQITWPDRELEDMPATCSLDIADGLADGASLEEVGRLLNLTRERVRQIETRTLARIYHAIERRAT